MKLSALLREIGAPAPKKDVEISFITDDSRKCRPNTLFVCHDGAERFVPEAREKGALCVVSQKEIENCVRTENTRRAFSTLCRAFFGYPDRRLRLVAVTGTNGKTTTASMLAFILELSGRKTGLLSTVVNRAGKEYETEMTTPDCFEISRLFSELVKSKGEFCVVEASSQGLFQERLFGLEFETAVLTNLTEDHLDYHKTFENYKNAKKKLFACCKNAVLNFDDPCFEEFSSCSSGGVVSYSVKSDEADYTARNIRISENEIDYALVSNSLIHRIKLHLTGDFNVENSLAACVAALLSGVGVDECADALKNFSGIKGRMEILDTNTPFRVIIDYAHTPDSLRRSLLSLRRFCRGKLIVLFGCGGDREKEKRPEMGKIASTLADRVFVTTDNPRSEDPNAIIEEILSGVAKNASCVFSLEDRREAIALALGGAKRGDIVLLAGKGHETYEQTGEEKLEFDERKIVFELLSSGLKRKT